MRFSSVRLDRFRNLADGSVSTHARHVLLVGPNGQGKTNFLEALYILCYGTSFRTANAKEVVRHGEKGFSLSATVIDDEGDQRKVDITFSEGKRTVRLDGREVVDRKELIYNIPLIVFSHDDISFVRGEPEFRRRFFDQTMSMYNPLFFDDNRRYRAVLRQRNAAIKEGQLSMIPIYDMQLAKYGIEIQRERTKAVYEFNMIFPQMYRKVFGTDINIRLAYIPSWNDCSDAAAIEERLSQNIQRDIRMQTTSSGVHRDRFVIVDDHGPFAQSGSTGQLRLASLVLRMAQTEFFRQKTGKDPILLIDDVLLELDHGRRASFLDMMGGYSQAFFTFLPDERYFQTLSTEDTLVYDVDKGTFERHEG